MALFSTVNVESDALRVFFRRIAGQVANRFGYSKKSQSVAGHVSSLGHSLRSGEVALVGAGPGAAELLTIAAYNAISEAQVVVYDRLVSREILDLIPPQARQICVGKAASFHSVPQSRINEILIEQACTGQRVVRLKGGDSFIFGRGGEELQQLAQAGISFRVIPGITAASGCTTYAGIALTHRDYAQAVTFITGHCKVGGEEPDWPALAVSNHTLVIYMGRLAAQRIEQKLIEHGMQPDMPVAVIENGTRDNQRVLTATLGQLAKLADQVASPALLVIGDVVSLREQLAWFEQLQVENDMSA